MTRSMQHATFFIERKYDATPARVFAACSSPELKASWFATAEALCNGTYTLDFRIGGQETNAGGPEGGPLYEYVATFQDIVPDNRIVTTYEMYLDKQRISVSVASIELLAEGSSTRLKFTEQGVFLDGLDIPIQREHGTGELLNSLGDMLRKTGA